MCIYIIKIEDEEYPPLLKEIKDPPQKLYVKGNIEVLSKNLIAIVGSRNFSDYGRIQTERFSRNLIKSGIGIVSGMASGIDTFAHSGAIKSGGKTIAVLGSGFNYIYPKQNKELFNLIIQTGGAIVSEYPPNTQMEKKNFPKRNRIISGLCLATLVVEAAYRSGTSITANLAIKQKRKLYCLPNSIGNKNSYGTLNLLKSGAKLVTNAMEIIEDLGELNHKIQIDSEIKREEFASKKKIDLNNYNDFDKQIILIIKQNAMITPDEICKITNIAIQKIKVILMELEINEIIENYSGCQYKLKEGMLV